MLTHGKRVLSCLALFLLTLPLCSAPRPKPAPRATAFAAMAPYREISWQPLQTQVGLWDAALAFRTPEEAPPSLRLVPVALPGESAPAPAIRHQNARFLPSCRF